MTSVTRPSDVTLAYNIWDETVSQDFSQTWTQTPACGHAFTDSFTFTGTNTVIKQEGSTGRLNVQTNDKTKENTYSVTL